MGKNNQVLEMTTESSRVMQNALKRSTGRCSRLLVELSAFNVCRSKTGNATSSQIES